MFQHKDSHSGLLREVNKSPNLRASINGDIAYCSFARQIINPGKA